MKVCNKCKVELVVGENIAPSRLKNCDYICKKCSHNKTVNWNKNNLERRKELNFLYNRSPNKKIADERIGKSIPPGVYEILYKGKRVYVGQSKIPYKRIYGRHFTKQSNLDEAYLRSPVGYRLSTGEIKREDLSFNMLQYEDDKQRRLKIEREYITQSTDLWNTEGN